MMADIVLNGNKWSIFYLFKELITICRDMDIISYRGQRQIGPRYRESIGIFVVLMSKSYASQFEKIYLDISKGNFLKM